jgi:hypothetical protein
MPSSSIANQDCVRARRDLCSDLFQMFTHGFAVGRRHDGHGANRAIRVQRAYPERDKSGVLKSNISYFIGPRGEQKLKLSIAPSPIDPIPAWGFAEFFDRVILGPALSKSAYENSSRRIAGRVQERARYSDIIHAVQVSVSPPINAARGRQ